MTILSEKLAKCETVLTDDDWDGGRDGNYLTDEAFAAKSYAWLITKCREKEDQCYVGVIGPRWTASDKDSILSNPNKLKFRLYEESEEKSGTFGQWIAEGYFVPGVCDVYGSEADGTEPYHDFGLGNWGCFGLKVQVGRQWWSY